MPVLRGVAAHATAFDPTRHCIWVFGGSQMGNYTNALFSFPLDAPNAWKLAHPSGPAPSPRVWSIMVYDPPRDRLLLYGGFGKTDSFSDAWELPLSGSMAWNRLTPGGTPPELLSAQAAIYDKFRQRLLVLGATSSGTLGTWALALTGLPTWTMLAPANPPPAMPFGVTGVHDYTFDRLVVAGPVGASYKTSHLETWQLSLSGALAWSPVAATGTPPGPLFYGPATYDELHRRMVAYWADTVFTLSLAGPPTWSAVQTQGAAPPVRFYNGLVYDRSSDHMLLVGGGTGVVGDPSYGGEFHDDVWSLPMDDTLVWNPLVTDSQRPPQKLAGHAMAVDAAGSRMWVVGGSGDVLTAGVWELGLSDTDPRWRGLVPSGDAFPARTEHTATYDPARHRILVFGGYAGGARLNDLWELSLEPTPKWTRLTPGGTPPSPRDWHTAILDAPHDRIIVFGGSASDGHGGWTLLNDVWSLSLAGSGEWSPLSTSGPVPAGRGGHTAAYDAARQRMIVAGGEIGQPYASGDIWSLSLDDNPTWSLIGSGPGLEFHAMCIDPIRDRLLMMGGDGFGIFGPPGYDYTSTNATYSFPLGAPGHYATLNVGTTYPQGRASHTAMFDAAHDRLIVIGGGVGGNISISDLPHTDPWMLQFDDLLDAPPVAGPAARLLAPPFPNPARTGTSLRFALAQPGQVSLRIHDAQGRLVRTLVRGPSAAGEHSADWDLRDDAGQLVAPGLYFCEWRDGPRRAVQRLAVVR